MSTISFHLLIVLLSVLLLGLLFSPVANFLWGGTRRRDSIVNTFTDPSIDSYFEMMEPGDSAADGTKPARERLVELYEARYGPKRYLWPAVMLSITAGVAIFWALHSSVGIVFDTPPSNWMPTMPAVAIAALSGAYMWVVSDLQQRYRASDLGWQKLTEGCLRFVIAIPAAYAFGALANDSVAMPVAFLLGAFPTKTIMKFSRRTFRGRLKMDEATAAGQWSVNMLQGIDVPIGERFEDEAITSITQLAYCDVIDLAMRTGYAFSFIVVCASQALAWLYLESHLAKLRIFSLRGAQEIGTLVDQLEEHDADAEKTLKAAAAALDVDEKAFWHTLSEIAYDPYTLFLREIWQTPADDPAILIHALLPDPVGPDRDNEIVTMVNEGEKSVSLDGWWLANGAGRTFELNGIIEASSTLELTLVCGTPFLHNRGDEVRLMRPDGSEADVAAYAKDQVIEGEFIQFGS